MLLLLLFLLLFCLLFLLWIFYSNKKGQMLRKRFASITIDIISHFSYVYCIFK